MKYLLPAMVSAALFASCAAQVPSSQSAASSLPESRSIRCDVVDKSLISDIDALVMKVPAKGSKEQASIDFLRKKAFMPEYRITEALDLYTRDGELAIVSGGIFGENFTPIIKARIFFNHVTKDQTGFAELTFGGEPMVHVNLKDCR